MDHDPPVVRIVDRDDPASDLRYWLSRPPEERVAAVDFLRLQCLLAEGKTRMPRFEHVLRVVDRRP